MSLHVFNAALLLGWLLVLAGGVLWHPAAGLVASGLLLLVLVFVTARFGGVYAPDKDRT